MFYALSLKRRMTNIMDSIKHICQRYERIYKFQYIKEVIGETSRKHIISAHEKISFYHKTFLYQPLCCQINVSSSKMY